MEKPMITDEKLEACAVNLAVSLAAIPGGLATYLVCNIAALAEIVSWGGAELA